MTQPAPPPPPLQASDPARLTDGQIVPRYAPPAVGGGSFRVDVDRAPQTIRQLEAAAIQLAGLREEAQDLGRVAPPASDTVSADAATVLGATAVGGNGSLLKAIDAGAAQLEELVQKMKSDLAEYRVAERTVGQVFESDDDRRS